MANSNTTDASLGSVAGMGVGSMFGPMGAMAGSAIGGLIGGMMGGNPNQDAINQLQAALSEIQAIPTPTVQDLTEILQPLVQQGVITPQAYQTVTENPQQFISTLQSTPTEGLQAEQGALAQLQDIYQTGGNTPQMQEQLAQTEAQLGQNENAQQQAIMQNAAERGVATSGATTSAQLAAAGRNAYNANQQGIAAQGQEYQAALTALANAGTLGGNVQNQETGLSEAEQAALNTALGFNATNTQAQENLNTSTANQAQAANLQLSQDIAQYNNQIANQQAAYNAALPQTVYQDTLGKAEAAAGEANNLAGAETTGTEMTAGEQAGLVGGLGNALSSYENTQTLANAIQGLNPTTTGGGSVPASGSANSLPSTYGITLTPTPTASTSSELLPTLAKGGILRPGGDVVNGNTKYPMNLPPAQSSGGGGSASKLSIGDLLGLVAAIGGTGYGLHKAFGEGSHPGANLSEEVGNTLGTLHPEDNPSMLACGGITNYESGGPVAGNSPYPGDDKRNDEQLALLSGGEAVLPRTVVQSHPLDVAKLLSFRGQTPNPEKINPEDIKSVLQALSLHRTEEAGGLR